MNRTGADLEPGGAVRFGSPRRGLHDVLFGIVEIDQGDGRAKGVRHTIVEAVFALVETPLGGGD